MHFKAFIIGGVKPGIKPPIPETIPSKKTPPVNCLRFSSVKRSPHCFSSSFPSSSHSFSSFSSASPFRWLLIVFVLAKGWPDLVSYCSLDSTSVPHLAGPTFNRITHLARVAIMSIVIAIRHLNGATTGDNNHQRVFQVSIIIVVIQSLWEFLWRPL